MPSRLEMQAESEMAIVRPLFLGCDRREKMIPSTIASKNTPNIVCQAITTMPPQQSFGDVLP